MNKLRVFTSFSGYDSQCMALDKLKQDNPYFDYELVGWSEIDKYAIQAHNSVYPQWSDRNYGDISKIDWSCVPDLDLFTYSSPCQDFSNAGLQKGAEEGSGTRSSLLWECRKAILAKKPKYLLFENVKAVTSKKFMPLFQKWKNELVSYGYTNFYKVLNAKDYGIPQNRERVYMISILGDGWFNFPKPFKLNKRLKDVLETDVDDKYYLSNRIIKGFIKTTNDKSHHHNFNPRSGEDIACTIRTAAGSRVDDNYIFDTPNINNPAKLLNTNPSGKGMNGWVFSSEGLSLTLTTNKREEVKIADPSIKIVAKLSSSQDSVVVDPTGIAKCITSGHFNQPKIIERMYFKGKEIHNGDGLSCQNSETFFSGGIKDLSPTLRSSKHDAAVVVNYRIRKLTARECFRLMGVSEQNIDKIQRSGVSRTQQYKMAGNSIVVDVLYYIFNNMFIEKQKCKENIQMNLNFK